jgi:hypothetical protein
MMDDDPKKKTWILDVDPGTLVFIASILILMPLLLSGFFAH